MWGAGLRLRSRAVIASLWALVLCGATSLEPAYFPPTELRNNSSRDGWSKFLSGMKEQNLARAPGVDYAVRVTVLRGYLWLLKLEHRDNGQFVSTYKEFRFSDQGIVYPVSERTTQLTNAQFDQLASEIEREQFLSVREPDYVTTNQCASWLTEVYDGKNYHALVDALPQMQSRLNAVARAAAAIAGVRLEDNCSR